MGVKPYKSWAITLSLKHIGGIQKHGKIETMFMDYLRKQDYYFLIAEDKEGEHRHLHAQIWLGNGRRKGKIVEPLDRMLLKCLDDYSPACKKCVRGGVKIAYNDDFVESYLKDNEEKLLKDNLSEILLDKRPNNTYDYYPTEEEQEEVVERANTGDTVYFDLEKEFMEYTNNNEDYQLIDVANFLAWKQNVKRNCRVLADKKLRIAKCKALYHYMKKKVDYREWVSEFDKESIHRELDDGLYTQLEFV